MQINSESRIGYPKKVVYEAYRDNLCEVVGLISDIREVVVKSRDQTPEGVRIHNLWVADREVPRVLSGVLRPDMMCWDDHAMWHDEHGYCEWRLTIPAFPNQVRCSGRNTFIEDGAGTRVILTGDLDIDLANIPGVPRLLARRLKPQVEGLIVRLITPNLKRVNEALGDYLDQR